MNHSPLLPFDRAYWVVPSRLLAGCYPGDTNPEEARRKLQGLLQCGVSRILSLMRPDEVGIGGNPFVDYRAPGSRSQPAPASIADIDVKRWLTKWLTNHSETILCNSATKVCRGASKPGQIL